MTGRFFVTLSLATEQVEDGARWVGGASTYMIDWLRFSTRIVLSRSTERHRHRGREGCYAGICFGRRRSCTKLTVALVKAPVFVLERHQRDGVLQRRHKHGRSLMDTKQRKQQNGRGKEIHFGLRSSEECYKRGAVVQRRSRCKRLRSTYTGIGFSGSYNRSPVVRRWSNTRAPRWTEESGHRWPTLRVDNDVHRDTNY